MTFKVTAKLDSGFHVYKYSKTKEGPGPENTRFDFFDTAGLKIDGDWVPSQPPEKHKDPNFAELDVVEYHEDEVTWSIKLKIPAGTEPGKKTLLCQAHYQVCNAKTCSLPGQWTLPEAVLTVLAADAPAPNAPAAKQSAGPELTPAAKPAAGAGRGERVAQRAECAADRAGAGAGGRHRAA